MTEITKAKESLKRTLLENNGNISHPAALEAIATLQFLSSKHHHSDVSSNDNEEYTNDPIKHTGTWRMISAPSFPGRLPSSSSSNDDHHDDGTIIKARYTLGRMAFNMFKPTNLVCCVHEILNIVEPLDDNDNNNANIKQKDGDNPIWERSYNNKVIMDIEIKQSSDTSSKENYAPTIIRVPAQLVNYGVCTPSSSHPSRLSVKFTGGILQPNFDMNCPSNTQLTMAWKQTFEGAISKELQSQSIFAKVSSTVSNVVMKLMMGLRPPVDDGSLTQSYWIERPIVGYLDILYMDDDIRVSRGNRGTVVVVERV